MQYGALVTDELYAWDAYLVSTEAVVEEVRPEGVILDRTVFYALGGGQPGDSGTLRWQDRMCRIVDTVKRSDLLLHVFEPESRLPHPGSTVVAEIDWARRHLLMRTHTALHALSGTVYRSYGAKVTGGSMEPGIARMDFELEQISRDFGDDVEQMLNSALSEDRPVSIEFLPRARALSDPDLIRTKVNLIPEWVDPIRIVDIEGLDRQADGGTHVGSTGEVGVVRIVKTESKGKAFKRMRIKLQTEESD
jgi:misacylated tRNA(Ala) deacylase